MAKILVIDDNPDILAMVRMLLERKGGHTVEVTADGEEGLQRALRGRYDLLIIDVMMPRLSGYEIVRRLRKNRATAQVPIIILSARGQPIDMQASETIGADLHLTKPVNALELVEEVGYLLKRRNREKHKRHVVAVFSMRGGIGKTTIAVNLALLLQRVAPTTLIDLSMNGGHCAMMLGLHPLGDWGLLFGQPTTSLTTQRVATLTTRHQSGLLLFAAPSEPLMEQRLTPAQTKSLVAAALGRTPLVVLDLPSTLSMGTTMALREASRVLLIGGLHRPDVETTRKTLPILMAMQENISLVINSPAPAPSLKKERMEQVLRYPVAAMLSYHLSATTALLHGKPLVEDAPQSPLSKALQALVRVALS